MVLEDLRRHAIEIFKAGLKAVDPYTCVRRALELEGGSLRIRNSVYDLGVFDRIIVIGAGKAAAPMGRAAEDVLGEKISEGVLVTKYGHSERLRRIRMLEAGHPLPDDNSVFATEEILRLISGLDEKTLIICLISGGGSALLVSPAEGITLSDKIVTTRLLLACGATIQEINCIRKHISRVKGGRLAAMASPARVLTLALSDVIGDYMDVIASGPTAPDISTYGDALSVLERYGITDRLPRSVLLHLRKGAGGDLPETHKPHDPIFTHVQNEVIGSLKDAVIASAHKASGLGYRTLILSSRLTGEAREIGRVFAAMAHDIRTASIPMSPPACIIAGGETTVTVTGDGKGGRNQEMALSAAIHMAGLGNVLFLSGGTDGTDGPTDAAGAFADGTTLERAKALSLDAREYLARNDSYSFFKSTGDLFITGPTKTNVMDIQVLLVSA